MPSLGKLMGPVCSWRREAGALLVVMVQRLLAPQTPEKQSSWTAQGLPNNLSCVHVEAERRKVAPQHPRVHLSERQSPGDSHGVPSVFFCNARSLCLAIESVAGEAPRAGRSGGRSFLALASLPGGCRASADSTATTRRSRASARNGGAMDYSCVKKICLYKL